MRLRIAGIQVINYYGDRLGSVAGRLQNFQANASEFQNVAVVKRGERVPGFGRRAKINRCAYAVAQLQMPGDEIGVQMGQKYVFDLESVLSSKRNVLVGIALGVDDGSRRGGLVTDNVRSVRQAREIKLLKEHAAQSSFGPLLGLVCAVFANVAGAYFGCGIIRR